MNDQLLDERTKLVYATHSQIVMLKVSSLLLLFFFKGLSRKKLSPHCTAIFIASSQAYSQLSSVAHLMQAFQCAILKSWELYLGIW